MERPIGRGSLNKTANETPCAMDQRALIALMAPKRPKPGVRTRDGGEYTCPGCSAVYRVTVFTSPFKDTNHEDCGVCNLRIKSWEQATAWWSYELTKRPAGR